MPAICIEILPSAVASLRLQKIGNRNDMNDISVDLDFDLYLVT